MTHDHAKAESPIKLNNQYSLPFSFDNSAARHFSVIATQLLMRTNETICISSQIHIYRPNKKGKTSRHFLLSQKSRSLDDHRTVSSKFYSFLLRQWTTTLL